MSEKMQPQQQNSNLSFNVKLAEFDGPLDVLDSIIREHKLNILELDIAKLAEQYLVFIKTNIDTISIDEASDYLSMATYLLELKSKRILPDETDSIENANFEYERNKLIQRIIEFKKYKDAIPKLLNKQSTRMEMFAKQPDDLKKYTTEKKEASLPEAIDPERLLKSMQSAFEK
jgi:segregation and condensation protein A